MRVDRIKLITLMAKKDISILKLSELSGVSRVTVNAVKSGKSCALTTAQKLADGLGVDVTEIMETEG